MESLLTDKCNTMMKDNNDIIHQTDDVEDIQKLLENNLCRDGTLNSIKITLRSRIVQNLFKCNTERPTLNHNYESNISLELRALYSLVGELLISNNMKHTYQIFNIESGLEGHILSNEDATKVFGIDPKLHLQTYYKENDNCKHSKMYKSNEKQHQGICTLYLVLLNFLKGTQDAPTQAMMTQNKNVYESRKNLDIQLNIIEEKYKKSLSLKKTQLERNLEQKMANFRLECEQNSRKELSHEIERFKSLTLIRMKSDEAKKRHDEINMIRKEIEADYYVRLQKILRKEAANRKSISLKQKEFELSQYDARQELLKEIDAMKKNEAERERKFEEKKLQAESIEKKAKEMMRKAHDQIKISKEKELELKNSVSFAYEKAKKNAKKVYEDAIKVARQKSVFFDNELKELHSKYD